MSETRGYQTINDRTDGWGPGVVENDQPTADATPEAKTTRWGRSRVARVSSKPNVTDTAYNFELTGTVATSGSNTALGSSHPEVAVTNRTSTALPTSAVAANRDALADERVDNTVGSIVDRTDGWGHSAGTQNDRKDA